MKGSWVKKASALGFESQCYYLSSSVILSISLNFSEPQVVNL